MLITIYIFQQQKNIQQQWLQTQTELSTDLFARTFVFYFGENEKEKSYPFLFS